MTKKVLTYSLAAIALLSGCADDFQSYDATGAQKGKGKLIPAGLLGGTVESGTSTRAYSPGGKFVWMPEVVASDGTIGANANGVRTNQKIGLCWTGVNTENSDFGAVETAGENVYSNYMYEHIGWMEKGVTAPDFDECTGVLLNGAYLVGETPAGAISADFASTWTGAASTRWNKYYYGDQAGQYTKGGQQKSLNLGAGVFKTDNASVFEGQYIVYFPYTDQFTKGPIIAHQPESFTVDPSDDKYVTYSKYAFLAGVQNHYDGGNAQSSFTAGIYSSSVTINLKSKEGAYNHPIKRVILYSADGIAYETGISASSVIDARIPGTTEYDMTKVTKVGEEKKTNAIYADLKPVVNASWVATFADKNASANYLLTLPVLPQTANLSVILVDDNEKTVKVDFGETELKAAGNTPLTVQVKASEFTTTYYAVDEVSMVDALKKINAAGNDGAAADANRITLLRDINMLATNDDEYTPGTSLAGNTFKAEKNVKIIADASSAGANLIITGNKTTGTSRTFAAAAGKNLTIDVPVIIEGYGCCNTKCGEMNVTVGKNNVVFNGNITNYGKTNINFGAGQGLVQNINGKFTNTWDEEVVKASGYTKGSWGRNLEGGILTISKANDGTTKYDDQSVLNLNGSLINDGSVEVKSDAELSTEGDYGTRSLKVNVKDLENTGKLKVGKSSAAGEQDIVGGDVIIKQNAILVVTGSLRNTNVNAWIHAEGDGHSDTYDGRIDINCDAKNNGTVENDGVINIVGNFDNSNGLFLDNLTGQVGGKAVNNGSDVNGYSVKYVRGINKDAYMYRTDLKEGIYVSKTNTNQRMAFILNDAVESKSCNVIDVVGCDNGGVYDFKLSDYGNKDITRYDVRVKTEDGSAVSFACTTIDNGTGKYINSKNIGHCMDVHTPVILKTANELNVVNNLTVVKDGSLTQEASVAFFNVGNTIEVKSGASLTTTTISGNFTTTKRGIKTGTFNNSGTVTTNDTFYVTGNFNIKKTGELNSNGNNNVVGQNFELEGLAIFAARTTTDIQGTFNSKTGSMFKRLGLNGGNSYRATVNCNVLGLTQGATVGGWPTEY